PGYRAGYGQPATVPRRCASRSRWPGLPWLPVPRDTAVFGRPAAGPRTRGRAFRARYELFRNAGRLFRAAAWNGRNVPGPGSPWATEEEETGSGHGADQPSAWAVAAGNPGPVGVTSRCRSVPINP